MIRQSRDSCSSTSVLKITFFLWCGSVFFGCAGSWEQAQDAQPAAISVSEGDRQRMIAWIVREQKKPGRCEFSPGLKFNRQGQAKGIYLVGNDVNDTNLSIACSIPTLEHLELTRTRGLTESSFGYLRNAHQLKVLCLSEACRSITPGIIRAISTLQNLQRLEIHYSRIEPGALRSLSRMPSLELVDLYDCSHTEFVSLFTVSILKGTDTEKSKPRTQPAAQLEDRDFEALLECKRMREIHVDEMRLSDRAIRTAARSRSLRQLHLAGGSFSQEAVEWLRSHSQIKVVTHSTEEHWSGTLGFWADAED